MPVDRRNASSKISVCIAQINYKQNNVKGHIERIKNIIKKNRSADLIVFPELLMHGHPSMERPAGLLYRKVKKFYAEFAGEADNLYKFIRDVNARVIIGELKGQPGKFYNVATYIDKKTIDSYRKTHVHWSEKFIPGNKLKVFNSPFGKIGINICFDAAFPEVWRILALRGAKIIVNISAVPASFPVDHMWLRLKSAALNNQVFVVYANRPGSYFAGYSAVFDPMGRTIASAARKEAILKTSIDLKQVDTWRKQERIYQSMRPVIYREISKHPGKRVFNTRYKKGRR